MKMFNSMQLKLLAAGVLSASVMVGCGSDKDADPSGITTTSGKVTAAFGALQGATCDVTNPLGISKATVTTGADGTVDLSFDTVASDFALIVSCTGGSYFNEATGGTDTNNETVESIMPDLATFTEVGQNLAVTTLTDMATKLYKSLPAADKTPASAKASLTEIVRVMAPGLGDGVNLLAAPTPVINGTTPVGNTPAGIYASYLAGLAKIAQDKGITPSQLGRQLGDSVTAGTAIDPTVVNNLVAKAQEFATEKNTNLGAQPQPTGAGGVAVKPGATGGTGATGATGAGATGG